MSNPFQNLQERLRDAGCVLTRLNSVRQDDGETYEKWLISPPRGRDFLAMFLIDQHGGYEMFLQALSNRIDVDVRMVLSHNPA